MGGAGDASALKASSTHACTTALQSIHTPLRSTDCTAESTATKPVNTAQELLSGPKETQNNKDSRSLEETQRKSPKESRANRSAWTGFSIEELLKPSTTQDTHNVAKTTTTTITAAQASPQQHNVVSNEDVAKTTTRTAEMSQQQHNAVCNKGIANKTTDATTRRNEAVTDNTGSDCFQAATEKGRYATDTVGDDVQRIPESVMGASVDKTVDNSRNHDNTGLTVTINADVVSGSNSSDGNIHTSTGSAINGEKSKSSDSNSEPKDTTDSSKNGEIVSPETRETLSLFDAVHSMLSNISGEPETSYRTPKPDATETVENVSHKEGSQTTSGSSEKASHNEGAENVDSVPKSSEETAGQRKMISGGQNAETGVKLTPPSVVIPGRS